MQPGTLTWRRWVGALLVAAVLAQTAESGQAPAGTLPAVIPIFPLEDAMLFPNASRPLHIFEPRYRAMVADALKGDRIIGMVTLRPGYEANYEGRPPIFPIGCAGLISDVEELPDGRFNIVLRGLTKFRVASEDGSRPYRLASVSAIPEAIDDAGKTTIRAQRQRLEELLAKSGSDTRIPPEIADQEVIDALAQYLPLEPPERQALLELDGALSRAKALIGVFESMVQPR
jgi:hypothetical protein